MMRILAALGLAMGLALAPLPAQSAEAGLAGRVANGTKEAGLAASGPKPFVDIVCPIMEQQAESRGLPPMAFVCDEGDTAGLSATVKSRSS